MCSYMIGLHVFSLLRNGNINCIKNKSCVRAYIVMNRGGFLMRRNGFMCPRIGFRGFFYCRMLYQEVRYLSYLCSVVFYVTFSLIKAKIVCFNKRARERRERSCSVVEAQTWHGVAVRRGAKMTLRLTNCNDGDLQNFFFFVRCSVIYHLLTWKSLKLELFAPSNCQCN
jgi:hypothetical protein